MSSCKHKYTQEELNAMEKQRTDSLMSQKRINAQDSISKMGDRLFAGFSFGMTKNEYEKAYKEFVDETNGRIEVENIVFHLSHPNYLDGKLSHLPLEYSEYIYSTNGQYLSTDYLTILKNRFVNRLGLPVLFLNEDFQDCDSTSEQVRHIIWIFDNRVITLSLYKYIVGDMRLKKTYYIMYSTPEEWKNTKNTFDEINNKKKREKEELKEKAKKYSDVI